MQRDETEFGPDKSTSFSGDKDLLDWRWYIETRLIKQPPNKLNLGDLDNDEYYKLFAAQTNIDSDGFPVNYLDWQREGEDDDGEDYVQWMSEIDGDLWFDKFDHSNTNEFNSIRNSGLLSVNILGVTGLLNSAFAIYVAFAFLGNFRD